MESTSVAVPLKAPFALVQTLRDIVFVFGGARVLSWKNSMGGIRLDGVEREKQKLGKANPTHATSERFSPLYCWEIELNFFLGFFFLVM